MTDEKIPPFSFIAHLLRLAAVLPHGNGARGSNPKRSGYKQRLGRRITGQLDAGAMRLAQQEASKHPERYLNRHGRK